MYVLVVVYGHGVEVAFSPPTIYIMATLVVTGLFALWGYWSYASVARWHMRRLSPIALALGAIAVVVGGFIDPLVGGALIVIAYLVELAVGLKLYHDFKRESRIGAGLFLAGVAVFMLFLPFAVLFRGAALVSLVGDVVKVIGLFIILINMIKKEGGSPLTPTETHAITRHINPNIIPYKQYL
ncbi:MAG: hypothetical protein F7C38_00930 [Desulfurococcales archaeon]|nr:hypothetical protein [Desulfurococcales archaeon]